MRTSRVLMTIAVASMTFGISSSSAGGSLVDHASPHVVAFDVSTAAIEAGAYGYMLAANGSVWRVEGHANTPRLIPAPDADPPIPVGQIKWWSLRTVVSMTGEVWQAYWVQDVPPYHHEWANLGVLPVGPISNEQRSVGEFKADFKSRSN
jgi:hypothetical protein